MQINGNDLFIGAYNERNTSKSAEKKINVENNDSHTEEVKKAMEQIREKKGNAATVSVSQESKDFLCSEAGYEKMKKDIEELYSKNALQQKELMQNNEDDVFWSNTGNQWLVFSEKLYNNGFYDNMSDEEVKGAETLLAKITAGMDHLSRTQYQTGMEFSDYYGHGANYFMGSNEVNMELESSAAALKAFSDQYLNEENKEEFNSLIDSYYSHNEQIIEGYQSPVESFHKAVNSIHEGKYENSAVNYKHNQGMKNESSGINNSIFLGGITHSSEEKTQYQAKIASLFEQMRQDGADQESIWGQIRESFVNYSTKNSDNQNIRNYVMDQAQYTFKRMEGYWSELF